MKALRTANLRTSNLRDRVGNGLPNRPGDVLWVKEALQRLGRYNDRGKRHPFIDRELQGAIDGYQWDRGLRRDGFLAPSGETECTLCVELARLLGRTER